MINSEDAGIDDELWDLYREYRELFLLEDPFRPQEYLIANDLDEHTWTDLGTACIESEARFDVCRKDVTVRRIRQIAPQLTLNLEGIQIPTINFPALPSGVTSEQIAGMVEQLLPVVVRPILNEAVERAVDMFLSSLSTAGFEIVDFNSGWRME